MHSVTFACKRAYYATLGLTRKTLRKMGLTAARFDLLYLIHSRRNWPPFQADLHRTLGVCASVVSRMLKSLEALGYVRRNRGRDDRRRREVTLTDVGLARIERGIQEFITWGFAQLALESALVEGTSDGPWWDDWEAMFALDKAEWEFRKLRNAFGDAATLLYPRWHPDD
jgi:DNA-binding MarR family transcriptional regulator